MCSPPESCTAFHFSLRRHPKELFDELIDIRVRVVARLAAAVRRGGRAGRKNFAAFPKPSAARSAPPFRSCTRKAQSAGPRFTRR
jgi:hypothetical protein